MCGSFRFSFLTSVWWSKDGLYKNYRTGLFSYVCALTCIVPCMLHMPRRHETRNLVFVPACAHAGFLYWWYFTVEGVYVTLAAISASSLALLLHAVPPGQVELLRVTTFHTGKTMNLAFVDGSCKHDVTRWVTPGSTRCIVHHGRTHQSCLCVRSIDALIDQWHAARHHVDGRQ